MTSNRIVLHLLFGWGAILVFGCGGAVQDPYAASAGPEDGRTTERYNIRFEVSCDTCAIRWDVAGESGSLEETALWSHTLTVTLHPSESTVARLSAVSLQNSRPVSSLRIFVDGAVLAASQQDKTAPQGPRTPLRVEVRLPLAQK